MRTGIRSPFNSLKRFKHAFRLASMSTVAGPSSYKQKTLELNWSTELEYSFTNVGQVSVMVIGQISRISTKPLGNSSYVIYLLSSAIENTRHHTCDGMRHIGLAYPLLIITPSWNYFQLISRKIKDPAFLD